MADKRKKTKANQVVPRSNADDQLKENNMAASSQQMARMVADQLARSKMVDDRNANIPQLPAREATAFKRLMKCYEERQFKQGLKFAKQILGKISKTKLYFETNLLLPSGCR
jgi:predicted naringenin-chalcone synthase